LPVVLFLHGFTAVDPEPYRAWIDHIVRRGAIVVYPDYQTPEPLGTPWNEMLPNAVDGLRRAVAELEGGAYPPVDRSRMTVVGHSLGGVLAMGVAAVAAEERLPRPVALMPLQPGDCLGCSSRLPNLGVPLPDLEAVPAEAKMVMVVGEDDDVVGDAAAVSLWNGVRSTPAANRDYVVLRSDAHGMPPLEADHLLAQTGGFRGRLDALDWYGTWKLFDLLHGCAHFGERCDDALGGTPAQRFMGFWSDGVPIVEPVITDAPPGMETP